MCLLGMYFSETYTSVVVVNIIFPEQVMERSGARRSEVDEERRAERELAMERSGGNKGRSERARVCTQRAIARQLRPRQKRGTEGGRRESEERERERRGESLLFFVFLHQPLGVEKERPTHPIHQGNRGLIQADPASRKT